MGPHSLRCSGFAIVVLMLIGKFKSFEVSGRWKPELETWRSVLANDAILIGFIDIRCSVLEPRFPCFFSL